jgi:3-methyladenine DNA glycosylase Tag
MSNKLNETEQAARKIENLQQEYAEFNQFNWKTQNDLINLQADLE